MSKKEVVPKEVAEVASSEGDAIAKVMKEVAEELVRASANFPPMRSSHEGLAIIREEYIEFEQEVFRDDVQKARKEVKQLAAMSCRYLLDIHKAQEKPKKNG